MRSLNHLILKLLFATPLGLALTTAAAHAQQNDFTDVSGPMSELNVESRMSELGILGDIVVTGYHFLEDFVAPLMGATLLLGAVNMGARHGDMMGAVRYAIGGLFCFGLPYLIDVAVNFYA